MVAELVGGYWTTGSYGTGLNLQFCLDDWHERQTIV